ncbi:MAG: ABC transporter permease [Terrimicrobiaceae bacterium]|nr:ABC transporter permease [Terrimicrobiaceae bacterium]
MNTVIPGLVLRYVLLYTRNAVRLIELIFWPAVDLMVWGFLTMYLQQNTSGQFPQFITFLIGAMIFWDVLFRAQQGLAISFLEDVWTRNLLNVFVAPVRPVDYIAATAIVGLLRVAVTVLVLMLLAWGAYAFRLWDFQVLLIPFFANLLVFGWSLGMVSVSLILRWGQAAESLAWAVPFLIQPVSAVFYPVSVLPPWLQPVAMALPSTHVFEGMRAVLAGNPLPHGELLAACGLNVVYLAAASVLFAITLQSARERGLLVKIATH